MKKIGYIILVTLIASLVIVDIVNNFRTNDPIHYFSSQPHQLLLVAAIAIVGGMIAFWFARLSPNQQRIVKLLTVGFAASIVTFSVLYFGYQFARFYDLSGNTPAVVLLSMGSIAASLWYVFYKIFRKRVF